MSEYSIKYCQYCGNEIHENAVICPKCGCEVKNNLNFKNCRTCGATIARNAKFCNNCGANQRALIPAKLEKCKHCCGDIAKNVHKCPHCGKYTTNYIVAIVSSFIAAFAILILFICLHPSNHNTNSPQQQASASTGSNSTTTTQPQNAEPELYSDKYVNIKYIKLFDQSSVSKGTLYLQLKVTNSSNQTVTVLLTDTSVNKMSVQSGTALPIKIEPGNMSVSPFILFALNTGIVKAEEVNNIRFKLKMYDEKMNTIHETPMINLDL